MDKKLFWAIVLSVLTMFLYQYIVETRYPNLRQKNIRQTQTAAKETRERPTPQPVEIKEVSLTNLPEKLETIKTQTQEITLTDIGGAIRKIRLLNRKDPLTKGPATLIDTENNKIGILYTRVFFEGKEKNLDNVCELKNTTEDTVTYVYPQVDNIEITKQISFHNTNNTIELSIIIKNASGQTKKVGYDLVAGTGLDSSAETDKRLVLAQIRLTDKTHTFFLKDKRLKGTPLALAGNILWTSLKNRYYAMILKPQTTANSTSISSVDDKYIQVAVTVGPQQILPESTVVDKFVLYVGPQDYHALTRLNLGIEDAIGYGFLGGIGSFLLKLLAFFYRIFGNYGIAIICLTLLLNVILYPLTLKSVGSMKKMHSLQPQITKLKQDYKDNPQRLNKETWELYKKNKVNPLGGCLPMALQLPIFFALYKALMGSVELKDAGFLWIRDLSGPDAAFKLPVSLPILGNLVNILPIIMLGAMFLQQKLTQAEGAAGEEQKMMSILMPVIFGVMFYNLPSALVLYWVINTLIMIGIQRFVVGK